MKTEDLIFKFASDTLQAEWEKDKKNFDGTLSMIERELAIPLADNPSTIKAALTRYITYIHNLSYMKPRVDMYLKVALNQQMIYHRDGEGETEHEATALAQEECIPLLFLSGVIDSTWKGIKDCKAIAKTYLGMEYGGRGAD